MERCQKRIALPFASAYRTVSGGALLVIAGIPPIDLKAIKRTETHEGRDSNQTAKELIAEASQRMHVRWHER